MIKILNGKRTAVTITGVTAVLLVFVLTGCYYTPGAAEMNQTQESIRVSENKRASENLPEPENIPAAIPDVHHQKIFDEIIEPQGSINHINNLIAKEIAVDFVGYGVVHDIMAFTNDDTLTFQVDVRHDATRYVVLLNGENGNVTGLNRFKDEPAVYITSPEYEIPNEITPPASNSSVSRQTNEVTPPASGSSVSRQPNRATPPPASPPASPPANPAVSGQTNETTPPSPPPAPPPPPPSTSAPPPPASPPANPPASGQGNQSSNNTISLDRAIAIAYADLASRGISATYRSNSGIDFERGQRVWELLFRTHGERMPLIEYYINAENGSIVKFEWDD